MMKKLLRKLFLAIIFVTISSGINAQAKLVINGGVINITNGAVLVIDNSDNTAIIYNGLGYIQSEDMNNNIIWNIGPGNGNTYLIPFGNASNYLPVKFNAASGTGVNGSISFSTYPTPTWKNSDFLPAGVTNVNRAGADNSAKLVDRFWQIKPQGYSVKPTLTNLSFTYSDLEYAAPNTAIEGNFIAQRWNSVLQSWGDYLPFSTVNTATNTLSIASLAGSQLYDWWTIADHNFALPITLVNFNAVASNMHVLTSWQTQAEQNSDHFEIWRSKDGLQFEKAGAAAAAGNSSISINYSFEDANPYTGTSFYRLKMIDKDGSFTWSAIVSVTIGNNSGIFLYPNPAENFITINSDGSFVNSKPMVHLYDSKGTLVQKFILLSNMQQVNIASLPPGTYYFTLLQHDKKQTLQFIKK